MGTGAEHYRRAETLVDNRPDRTEHDLKAAHVHAMLAVAAAVALLSTDAKVGDSDEITDWARLVQPKALVGGRTSWTATGAGRAGDSEGVEPRRGDIWTDKAGNCWLTQIGVIGFSPKGAPMPAADYRVYLVRLDGVMEDDYFSVIAEQYGPLKLVHRPWLGEDNDCPF